MNSLEWINAEIIKWQEILDNFKKELIRVKGTRNEETILNHIEANELKLQYLNQIKTELEAWDVVKKRRSYAYIKHKNLFDLSVMLSIDDPDCEKLLKALEVEE